MIDEEKSAAQRNKFCFWSIGMSEIKSTKCCEPTATGMWQGKVENCTM